MISESDIMRLRRRFGASGVEGRAFFAISASNSLQKSSAIQKIWRNAINVFKSTTGGFINLEGVIQLKIDSIDIPKIWLTEDIIKATFFWLQNHIRTYFKEKSVIVWFVTDEYYMCPISHEVKERQYEHFYTFMAECFMKFLKPN